MAKEVDDPSKAAKSTFNMTPMIDVTFQLIVVFLCSLKFRTLDQKIESFLPKDVGLSSAPSTAEVVTRVSVKLRRKPGETATVVTILESRLGLASSDGVWTSLQARLREFKAKEEKVKGEIDADKDVPHGEVVTALDAFMAAKLTDVEFRGTQMNQPGDFRRPPGR
jgi:biopolymer transport protein ExbD